MSLKAWFLETRPQFLLLSVVLAFLGTCIAWYEGAFHLGFALLAFLGILLNHISVNVLNDYYDHKSGIDQETVRTPFSGGSGIIQANLLTPGQVLWLGIVAFILAVPIGIYFIMVKGIILLPLLVVAAICVLLYTPLLTRIGWPEWAPGLGMGSLPVLGAYFVQTGDYTVPAVVAVVVPGILVHNLLLFNEFPDVAADRKAGRKTLPIVIGKDRAAWVYSALMALVYLWIIGGVVVGQMPVFALLGLLTFPLALKAIRGSFQHRDMARLVPALGANVMVVLLTQLLMGIGYILARVFGIT
jgi:1,4-dihydroxy-2-naphthoate octaprenyltransferase